MYNIPKDNGVGVHWGVSSSGITGYGNLVLNGANQSLQGDTATAHDGAGYTVTHVTYNHNESATLDVWISGSASAINVTVGSATLPQPGDLLTITDSIATIFSGSNWIVGNTSLSRNATDLAKASISVTRFAKI